MAWPIQELRRFVEAALVNPVPRDHRESDAAFRRRRIVVASTLVIGAAVLAWALRITPGDRLFYVATLALPVVWVVGAVSSGPLHLGYSTTRLGDRQSRAVVQSLVLGFILLVTFLAGSAVVAQIPALQDPVDRLLAHASSGSLPLVAAITAVNGIAEELYFRGALYAAIGARHAVLSSTAVYALVTAATGIPLLVFAGVVLGTVVGLQRRVTGGILGPSITHLTWSLGMLLLLPHTLELFG
ncbi:MAG: CPBP family intramembrane metalloprotease [Tetrasphaera sp.]|nr:CPBP family intramembrane metalloprotease [Tetrasphaera sp.]